MGEIFNITDWFDDQKLIYLANFIAKYASADCIVAVGRAEYYSWRLVGPEGQNAPEIVIVSSDGDAITESERDTLSEAICSVASMIRVDSAANYSIEEYPVMTFSIESDEDFYGAIFVAILTSRPKSDLICQMQLAGYIEEEITAIFPTEGDWSPEHDPFVNWSYGTLFGDVLFDTQEDSVLS